MRGVRVCGILLAMMARVQTVGYAQPACLAPVLSDEEIRSTIEKERSTRSDLPVPFKEYRSTVHRQGCHYVYVEYGLPEAFHYQHVFTLNQRGVIVDTGADGLKCPDRTFTENELAEIVGAERAKRNDLPPAFANTRTRVDRLRCLYRYFEYAVPETGRIQVFTIDPLGEVMAFARFRR